MDDTRPARGLRALARQRMREEILAIARRHLGEQGASGLSLRAVARDVGMVSSAVYRYFDSRDALLTALILDAYNALGATVEAAEAEVDRGDLRGRFEGLARAARGWALADPHSYALVYGSPVPGYVAPHDTVGPATRATRVLADILLDLTATHRASGAPRPRRLRPEVVRAVAPVTEYIGGRVPPDLAVRAVMVWTSLFGLVSFELFGQLHNVIAEDLRGEFFDEAVSRLADSLGLPPSTRDRRR